MISPFIISTDKAGKLYRLCRESARVRRDERNAVPPRGRLGGRGGVRGGMMGYGSKAGNTEQPRSKRLTLPLTSRAAPQHTAALLPDPPRFEPYP